MPFHALPAAHMTWRASENWGCLLTGLDDEHTRCLRLKHDPLSSPACAWVYSTDSHFAKPGLWYDARFICRAWWAYY